MKSLPLFLLLTSLPVFSQQSLDDKLSARSRQAAEKVPAPVREKFAEGIEAVEKSGITKSAKQVGDQAPGFDLKDPLGRQVSLESLLKKGPVVLTWYRGGWCPYCNITLAAYQERLADIKAAGATLVALTPELPDKSLSTKEKNKLEFPVLTDLNHEVARKYGLVFKLTPEVEELYKGFFDLSAYNGEEAGDEELPLAATYIIDRTGQIRWSFLEANYRKRAEPARIVAFLKTLKTESP